MHPMTDWLAGEAVWLGLSTGILGSLAVLVGWWIATSFECWPTAFKERLVAVGLCLVFPLGVGWWYLGFNDVEACSGDPHDPDCVVVYDAPPAWPPAIFAFCTLMPVTLAGMAAGFLELRRRKEAVCKALYQQAAVARGPSEIIDGG